MPKQPKRPRDPAQLAKFIVDVATGNINDGEPKHTNKDEAAVVLGRKGGLKGGKVRAEKMSADERKIAAQITRPNALVR